MTETLTKLRQDNAELSSTLKTVVSSHSSLQVAVESLQSDIAARDSELCHLRRDMSRVSAERHDAVRASEAAAASVTSIVTQSTGRRRLFKLK